MLDKVKVTAILITVALVLLLPARVLAAKSCFCSYNIDKVSKEMVIADTAKQITADCVDAVDDKACISMTDAVKKMECSFKADEKGCKDAKEAWEKRLQTIKNSKTAAEKASDWVKPGEGADKSKIIPRCLLEDPSKNPEADHVCRDVSIFVYLLINIARYLFAIVGALALIMFVYGGFVLILSQGNAEKIKQGTQIIVAAVIGLVIMFGAYMLVQFLGEAVKINSGFKMN